VDAVQVVARIGDSVVDFTVLPYGARYRIGHAAGVDFPISSVGSFPLVDGDHVHVPAGLAVFVDGRRDPRSAISIAGTIELQIGLVRFTIQRVARAVQRVPRARVEHRLFVYLAGSLIVQLAILLASLTHAAPEQLSRRLAVPIRIKHVRAPQPARPPDAPKPSPPVTRGAAVTKLHATKRARAENVQVEMNRDDAVAELARDFDRLHVAEQVDEAGPLYDSDAAAAGGFGGGGHHFDVDRVAPLQTIAVTKWGLPTFIHAPGELAPIPKLQMCDDDSCLTRGPIAIATILATLEQHHAEIARCYREHTGDLVGQIRVRFAIGPDGHVEGKLGTVDGPIGAGTGSVGRCVAKLAASLRWPKAERETWVFFGIAFQPA
jgi:hypothetical protein